MAFTLFGISFFVLEIFTILYHANEESDDVMGGSTKTVQHLIENNSSYIKVLFFKLGTSNVHYKKKCNDTHHAIVMTTVMLLVLFQLQLKFPDFTSNKDHSLLPI